MKILHVARDPEGRHLVTVDANAIAIGTKLRCAAYRWRVVRSEDFSEPGHTVSKLTMLGPFEPQVGMILHHAGTPLTNEEIQHAVRRIPQFMRWVMSFDSGLLEMALLKAKAGDDEPEYAQAFAEMTRIASIVGALQVALGDTESKPEDVERWAEDIAQRATKPDFNTVA